MSGHLRPGATISFLMPKPTTHTSSRASIGFYGAVKDPRDRRDFRYAPEAAPKKLPAKVDLRPLCPRVHEQGHPLTCTAHALAGAFQFEQRAAWVKGFLSVAALHLLQHDCLHAREACHEEGRRQPARSSASGCSARCLSRERLALFTDEGSDGQEAESSCLRTS